MNRSLSYDVLMATGDLTEVVKTYSVKDILLAMELLVDKRASKGDAHAAVILGMAARDIPDDQEDKA